NNSNNNNGGGNGVQGGANTIHVDNLDSSTWADSTGWTAYIEVIVRRPNERGVRGVTVTGRWDDGTITSCVTDSAGFCDMRLPNIPNSQRTATMTITNLSHPNYTYVQADNADRHYGRPDNLHSDGTTITGRRR